MIFVRNDSHAQKYAYNEKQNNEKTNLNSIFIKIWNLDLKGALRNWPRNLHLFRDNREPRTENKN